MDLPPASSRPSRLSLIVHIVVVGSLALSFISGILIWYGQNLAAETLTPPAWLHASRVTHGCLNPLLCAVFGYLCCEHIRYGWALRANWVSGLVMEGIFALLILTALAVYYADEGAFRDGLALAHRWAGAALPGALIVHWVAGKRWAKKNLKLTCN